MSAVLEVAESKTRAPKAGRQAGKPAGAKTKPQAPAAKARPEPAAESGLSALDAAAKVLSVAKHPLNARQIVERMAERGLWTSPTGQTPAATISAAMLREIQRKGAKSRFRKAGRGLFAGPPRKATQGAAPAEPQAQTPGDSPAPAEVGSIVA